MSLPELFTGQELNRNWPLINLENLEIKKIRKKVF